MENHRNASIFCRIAACFQAALRQTKNCIGGFRLMPHKRLGMEMAMKNRRFSKVFKVLLAGMLMIITSVSACRVEASAYMEEPLICGDVDGDWIVSSQDALTVLKIVVNLQKPDAERFSAADVDDDGSITSADALLILKNVVGLETIFPAQLSHPEMLFGFSDQELELYYGASYYRNYNKNIPASYMISKEIRVDKQGTLQCAGYATALAFRYYGEDVTGQQIYDEIVDKEMDGTVAPDVLASFIDERGGYRGTLYMGTIEHLKSAVSTGSPTGTWYLRKQESIQTMWKRPSGTPEGSMTGTMPGVMAAAMITG